MTSTTYLSAWTGLSSDSVAANLIAAGRRHDHSTPTCTSASARPAPDVDFASLEQRQRYAGAFTGGAPGDRAVDVRRAQPELGKQRAASAPAAVDAEYGHAPLRGYLTVWAVCAVAAVLAGVALTRLPSESDDG